MKFLILEKNNRLPTNVANLVCLSEDNWDDFGYKTTFFMIVFDNLGQKHDIGSIKIGFEGQSSGYTSQILIKEMNSKSFDSLPNNFFSLGQDVDFYVNIWKLPTNDKIKILSSLNDIAYNNELFDKFKEEKVLSISLMRNIRSDNREFTIKEKYRRIFEDKSPLSNFKFSFIRQENSKRGGIHLDFSILAESMPSTNVHAIIGRNGVGKTTLLTEMIESYLDIQDDDFGFYKLANHYLEEKRYNKIDDGYFGHLIAVSFSVFDPFIPNDNNNPKFQYYSYIGLKETNFKLKEPQKYFETDFLESFKECKAFSAKRNRWLNAIQNLESDDNFSEMRLSRFMDDHITEEDIISQVVGMSSGHASVLLIMTQLVAKVEEKTLVLLDEPESHLHPPLLSAFIRALSDLLDNRNGIAIIATHSPVVLQEIPKNCVWKIERTGQAVQAYRPNIETFGENVGVLTREVFGLEVIKSGFHNLLNKNVEHGKTYDEILQEFNDQLGIEAKLLLKTLIRNRDKK